MLRPYRLQLAALLFAVAGCASTTTVEFAPSPQTPICSDAASAQVLWLTQWRSDQKDVSAREIAAAEGIDQFFKSSGCFKSAAVQRLAQGSKESVQLAVAEVAKRDDKVVLIAIKEFGPIVKIGASLALVEGGTEVVLDISEYSSAKPIPRTFNARWRNGGPGVVKGVATLPQDMQAALVAALQPPKR
jgi:hypothetical protein